MDIKGIIENKVSYQGNVSLSLKNKGEHIVYSIKNSGTKLLLDTITRALAGYSIENSIPKYIDIQVSYDGKSSYTSGLLKAIPLVGVVYGEPAGAEKNNGVLLLNATITYADKAPISAMTDARLVLLTEDMKVLASIEDDSGDITTMWESITSSTDAIVEWKLSFYSN